MVNFGQLSHLFEVPVVPGPTNTDRPLDNLTSTFHYCKKLDQNCTFTCLKMYTRTTASAFSALTRIRSTGNPGYRGMIRSFV